VGNTPKIFIGLVTHAHSRFNSEGQSSQRINELANALSQLGINVVMLISDRNDFQSSGREIGIGDRVRSAWKQVHIEKAWDKYVRVSSGPDSLTRKHGAIFYSGMFVKRATSYLFNSRSLARIANIDLSHLRVLKEGVASGSDWVLIIEDDAQFADPVRTAGVLGTVLEFLGHPTRSIFVNLSESINTVELRVDGIVSGGNPVLALTNESNLLEIFPAISNTVCANMYSLDFASEFARAIEVQGILPSVPIDWRLNQLIMQDRETPVECYWVKPGIFLQGSMHDDTNSEPQQ
jgi:hypothetical protein